MNIPKDKILELIRSKAGDDKATQAQGELPDQVDTDNDEHQNLLSKFGVDPTDLLKSGGGLGGMLGR